MFAALCLSSFLCFAQDEKTVTINTIDRGLPMSKTVLLHEQFLDGKVIFKDEAYAQTKFNYNRLTGQMLFLTPKKDTLALSRPETTAMVIIANDTFAFYDNSFIQKITHFTNAPSLYVKQYMKYIGKEKKGPYGTYSSIAQSNSNSTYTADDQITQYLSIDENMIYKPNTEYYLTIDQEKFYPAKKASLFKMLPQYKEKIKEYVESTRTNFNDKYELELLIKHIQKLQSGSKK